MAIDYFGEWTCPRCHQPGEYLAVERCDYYACAGCRVYWFVGCSCTLNLLTGTAVADGTAAEWIRDGRRLNDFERVDPDGQNEDEYGPCLTAERELNLRRQYAAPTN